MKRILVIGSSGAGKSTFSQKLHEILGLEIIHLDQHYWKPNWTKTENEEWQKKVEELMKSENWIMDGNYRSTMDLRLPRADTVIWLDFPPVVCLWRILKRRWKTNRVDELDNCPERVSLELVKWVLWKFPRDNRKDILRMVESLEGKKDVFVLRSNKDRKNFLDRLEK